MVTGFPGRSICQSPKVRQKPLPRSLIALRPSARFFNRDPSRRQDLAVHTAGCGPAATQMLRNSDDVIYQLLGPKRIFRWEVIYENRPSLSFIRECASKALWGDGRGCLLLDRATG